jgi:hypothetical protein
MPPGASLRARLQLTDEVGRLEQEAGRLEQESRE